MTDTKYIGTAPGRLDVMGGIADYSGSLVLQKQIKQTTTVTFKHRNDGLILAKTFSTDEPSSTFIIEYKNLLRSGNILDFQYAREQFQGKAGGSWAAYVIGCLLVLQHYKGIQISGAELEISSTIPEGKGVSSSAALEIATMRALEKAFDLHFAKNEMAKLAQIVENNIVGAPCGLMDQLASAYGHPNFLLPIICQPDRLLPKIEIPEYLHFVGIDSGLRHHVGGASYADVRAAAFMGYSIIAQHYGHSHDEILEAMAKNRQSLAHHGYLCNVNKNQYLKALENLLPEQISGEEYFHHYGSNIDSATKIYADKTYKVHQSVAHAIFENDRINHYYLLFKEVGLDEKVIFNKLGQYMYQSHDSYSQVGLGSAGTDRLVALAKEHRGQGIYGAKITGGGSGGTVCFLAIGQQGMDTCHKIHEQYQQEIGKNTLIIL